MTGAIVDVQNLRDSRELRMAASLCRGVRRRGSGVGGVVPGRGCARPRRRSAGGRLLLTYERFVAYPWSRRIQGLHPVGAELAREPRPRRRQWSAGRGDGDEQDRSAHRTTGVRFRRPVNRRGDRSARPEGTCESHGPTVHHQAQPGWQGPWGAAFRLPRGLQRLRRRVRIRASGRWDHAAAGIPTSSRGLHHTGRDRRWRVPLCPYRRHPRWVRALPRRRMRRSQRGFRAVSR